MIKNQRIRTLAALVLGVISVAVMYYVEQILCPGYFWKSLIKVVLFSGVILGYAGITRTGLRRLLTLEKPKYLKRTLILGLIGEAVILGIFFLIRGKLDLDAMRTSMMEKDGLTKQNCLIVLAYIICVNSFLEEAFFRGFLFGALKTSMKPAGAAIVSALLFALYHIGIVNSLFSPLLFIACILGLAAAGLLLQWLKEKGGSLFSSWMVHALANGAINTIGALIILMG